VYESVRRAFPAVAIAGGMHSYFTELNRRPPPADLIDLLTHSTCPIVHAADDFSVMETLQALPSVFASARALAKGKPYWIGPTAIGMRFNPYGEATMPNPDNARRAMVSMDPRQRGLFNAAWTLGYIAHAAAGGVSGLCLSATAGPFGIAWQKMNWPQPWFDDTANATAVFPVYHVIAGFASRNGETVLDVENSNPESLAAVAVETDQGAELWLANLTAEPLTANIAGLGPQVSIQRLDSETFRQCCQGPDGLFATASTMPSGTVKILGYGVLRVATASLTELH
jgi:hypothetical protein